jgi:DNA-binding transcriptional ArsR family regulator
METGIQVSGLDELASNAGEASQLLKLLANQHRLLILCHLVGNGEMTVNALADAVGLSQSALSQHLARLREDGLVAFRREAQTLYYRVADRRAVTMLKTLKRIFCP